MLAYYIYLILFTAGFTTSMIRIRSLSNIKYNVVTWKSAEGGRSNKCTANGAFLDRRPYTAVPVHPLSNIVTYRWGRYIPTYRTERYSFLRISDEDKTYWELTLSSIFLTFTLSQLLRNFFFILDFYFFNFFTLFSFKSNETYIQCMLWILPKFNQSMFINIYITIYVFASVIFITWLNNNIFK